MKYCETYAALLDLYVDGELSREEAAYIRAHLAECPGCGAYVEDVLAIRAAFPEMEDVELPEEFTESVMAAVRELEAPPERKEPRSRPKSADWKKILLPLAACFAIVFVLRGLPARGETSGATDNNAALGPAAASASTEEDQWRAVVQDMPAESAALADGYSVGLDAADAVPADMPAGGDDPAEPAAAENDQTCYTALQGSRDKGIGEEAQRSERSAIRLTSVQAGDLLDGMACSVTDGGERRYQLTAEEFDALLAALAERGVTPEAAETAEDGYLVYLTEN